MSMIQRLLAAHTALAVKVPSKGKQIDFQICLLDGKGNFDPLLPENADEPLFTYQEWRGDVTVFSAKNQPP